jgi:hypothetical protein
MNQAVVKIAARSLLALMLAIAAATAAVNLVNSSIASPQQPVREYLAALQTGQGGKALGLLHATVPRSDAAMLDGTALQTAASRIADVKIGDAEERTGNQLMVPVDYTIDGIPLRTESCWRRPEPSGCSSAPGPSYPHRCQPSMSRSSTPPRPPSTGCR